MGNKPNWGAALQAWGSGLGSIYSDNMRQEAERRKRKQDLADLNAANILAEQIRTERDGPIVPQPVPSGIDYNAPGIGMYSTGATTPAQDTFDYAGVSLPRAQFAGQRANQALDSWLKAHPITKPSDQRLFTWTDPVTGTQVTTTYEDYLQYTRPDKPTKPGEPTTPVVYTKTDGSSQRVEMRDSQLNAAIQSGRVTFGPPDPTGVVTLIERPDNDSIGKSGGTPKQVEARANALTTAALGEKQQKLGRDGVFIDTSAGGTLVGGQDFSNLVSPEYRRAFNQAATDSTNTGRWPINSPMEPLIAAIGKDTASQYIDLALPAGAQFDPGRANDPTDDRFIVPNANKLGWIPGVSNDREMKTIDFFKEYIIPTINEAKDADIGWQGLVKAAKTYGVNIDQLKGLLDKKKFAAYLATAAATQDAAPTPKTRTSVSVQKSDVAPVPGAVKLSDGKWYVRDASGKVVPVLRSGA